MGLALLEKANPNLMKPQCQRFAAALLALLSFQVSATTHYVDVNGNNPVSPYTSWATAATNIQDAVFHAGTGDTILVTNGIYQYGGYSFNGSNRVYIVAKNLTVQSVNGPAVTVIKGYQVPGTTNGNNAVRCVYLESGLTLSGFTLTNGATQTSGTPNGGGIYCQSTSALVTNCVIVGNAAISGGGVYSGTLINCALIGNIAGLPNISSGGGAAQSTLINCLLTGNQASYRGGAAAGCTLISCTIASNVGQVDGIDGSKLTNCISYYNFYDNGTGSGDGNVFNNCCTIPLPYSGVNIITNPPAFMNLTNGDFHLSPSSPCINAGNNSFIANTTDLDGNPRIVAGTVDIGAYEFQAPVRYVNVSNAAPASPFTNWITAATNIQDAIDVASAGDFIVVSNGTYNTGGRVVFGTMTNRVVINKAVTVQSVNGSAATIIAGLPNTGGYLSTGIRCVYLTNGAALIGFTLTNGASRLSGNITNEQSGAAVWCESTNAIISNCALMHSYANQFGGAAYQGTLNNCIITNNQAFFSGGGTYLANLNNCVVAGNKLIQGSGGGGASLGILNNCLVIGNFAPGYGGGTYLSTMNGCIVSNNSAGFGGGVCLGVANNSLISSNRASLYGGGACSNTLNNCILTANNGWKFGGGAYQSTLNNCTLVNNTASDYGGGAYGGNLGNCTIVSNSVYSSGGGAYSAMLNNCIVYYNRSPENSNAYSGNLNYCCTTPLPTVGVGNITNEPVFVNLAGGDFHLQTNSPCINSGNNTYVTSSTDLDGNPRIVGGTVDMGAYEFQTPSSVLSYAWAQQYGLPTDGSADYADTDGDGMNNWQEWRTGTIPNDPTSLLKMLTSTTDISGTTITWQSVSGMNYFIQRSSNLGAQPPFSTIQTNIVGQAGTTSWLDTTAVGPGPFFYRVGVQ
jgi:hypothetical protein